jgi:16S rRNA (uracil1498-N3)-methyltransferase
MQEGGNRFFFNFDQNTGFLSEEESHHLVNVLRKKEGDIIRLINGKGIEFFAKIIEIQKKNKKVKVELIKVARTEPAPKKEIVALVPLLKGGKTEFLIEKGVELGITLFIPFESDFTVAKPKPKLKQRLESKMISALKQCGRLWKPEIENPIVLKDFLNQLKNEKALKLCAEKEEAVKKCYAELKKLFDENTKIYLLSGPEGGFSKEEIQLIKEAGFIKISFSSYVLRSETAFLGLLFLINFL